MADTHAKAGAFVRRITLDISSLDIDAISSAFCSTVQ